MSTIPEADDIDYICNVGKVPHVIAGPDKNARLVGVDRNHVPATYNGHPVSHGTCNRHARGIIRGYYGAQKRQQPGLEGDPDES
jgi:hypothetical protein